MRLLSGNPGMYQHSVEHSTEGETTQHEPEHGEDTIARVKGTDTSLEGEKYMNILRNMNVASLTSSGISACFVLPRSGEGPSEEIQVNSRWSR